MTTLPLRYAILLALLVVMLSSVAMAQTPGTGETELRGRLQDMATRAPVAQAEVVLVGTPFKTLSDNDGNFVFKGLVPGTYALRATRMGYKPVVKEGVAIRESERLVLELPMTEFVIQLQEVTVSPGSYSFMTKGTTTRQTMSREDLESVPQLGEDVFRAVNRLPGLSSNDYSAHFSIRGGRHDETLILLDGLELYEPYHLKDFNEGALSLIDAEAIDGVQLMTGGFPAQYGNKRSGVFDIKSRTPDADTGRYSAGLSLINARAMAMGPLGKRRGSWLVLARSGYLDLVFGIIGQNTLPSPGYHDVFAKLQFDLSPAHALSFDLLHAGDRYKFDAASTSGFLDSLNTREHAKNHYGNSYVWSTLESALGRKTAVRTMVSAALVTRDRDGYEKYVAFPDPLYTIANQRDYSVLGAKQDWTMSVSDAYVVSSGVDVRRLHNKDVYQSVVNKDPNDPTGYPPGTFPIRSQNGVEKRGTRLGVYLSNRLKVVDPLILEVGGRFDRADYTGDRDFSPRTGAALRLREGSTLRLGWGRYRQIQGIDEVAALNRDNRYFRSELSEQWTAGFEHNLSSGAVVRLEGYLKEGTNLRPVYRNWKGGIDAFTEPNEDRILVFPRKSTARGMELFYDQKLGDRIGVRGGYSYAIAEEEVDRIVNVNVPDLPNYDRKHPIPQDQRHAVNLDMNYKFRRSWTLSSSFAFHTGWPATLEKLVAVTDEDGATDFSAQPIKIYGARLPNYLRLDMRATRRWTSSWGDMRLFVELVNLTNHSNVFGYDYFRTHDASRNVILKRDPETWFTLLPSAGVALSKTF